MKVIFMGTPDFSVPVLEKLAEAGHEIVLVVTQPDRQKGRGKAVQYSPVKEAALAHGFPVFQPVKLRQPEAVAELAGYPADVAVVVAFGQILPQSVLDMPRLGCVNVHASLLPMYRGADPIQAVILDGCEKTGVTVMQMDAGLDTGDILMQKEIMLAPDETGGSLYDKLSAMGAELILPALEGLENGTLRPVKQDGETCYAGMLRKEMGEMDWSRSAAVLDRQVRGLNPWPSAYTRLDGKLLKIWKAKVLPETVPPANAIPGTVLTVSKKSFTVQTGEGILEVLSLQPEGKKAMDTDAFLRGYPLTPGTLLGR